MRSLFVLLTLLMILPASVYSSQPLSRDRTPTILASWNAGIEKLVRASSEIVKTSDQAASLINSARVSFHEIPPGHLLSVSGLAAADAVEAKHLFLDLIDHGFTDKQERAKFDELLRSALVPVSNLFSYTPAEWKILNEELPEMKDGARFHDIALGILSYYHSILEGDTFKQNALSAVFDQAYFRAVSRIAKSPEEAIAHAKEIAADYGISLAPSVHNWARTIFAYAVQGRCDEALKLSQEPKDIALKSLVGHSDPEIAKGLVWLIEIEANCLGEAALSMTDAGKLQTARKMLLKGLDTLNKALNDIGRAHLGDANTARLVELRSAFLAQLGTVSTRIGDFSGGMDFLWQAVIGLLEDTIISASSSDTEYLRYTIFEKWNNNIWHKILMSAAFASKDPAVHLTSWQTVLLSKNLLAELARLERQTFKSADTPEFFASYRRMRNLLSTSVLLIQAGYGGKNYDQLLPLKRYFGKKFRTTLKDTEVGAFLVNPEQIRAALRPGDILLDYIIFYPLNRETMSLIQPPHYGVYVVSAEKGLQKPLDLGPAHLIDAAVARYRDAYEIEKKRPTPDETEFALLAEEVRQLVLDPVLAMIDTPKRLYISPVSRLSLMPFETMPTESKVPVRYLIESTDIVMLSTARDLARLHPSRQWCEPGQNICSATLIGDPQYARREGPHEASETNDNGTLASKADVSKVWQPFPRMKSTLKLVNKISGDLNNLNFKVNPLLGPSASEGALFTGDQPQVLLIASHGLFLSDSNLISLKFAKEIDTSRDLDNTTTTIGKSTTEHPRDDLFGDYLYEQFDKSMLSIIALAGAADIPHVREGHGLILNTDDGLLTAYEAEALNLEKTDLVILIACETGLGFIPSRSGAVTLGYSSTDTALGFRRALQIAGARTIVGSLWEVLDFQATQYARDFLHLWLANGETRYRAHHRSVLNLLKRARQEHGNNGHPVWWAGFVYQGDPGDLP